MKAQKRPPTKETHIAIHNSCAIPVVETYMEIGDNYIRGQNGAKIMTLRPSSKQKSYIAIYIFKSCY